MQIIYPSDFKFRINKITDSEGTVLDPSSYPCLIFMLTDNFGGIHKCIYDPEGTETTGAKMVDNVLYITIENYKLKGKIKYKIGTKDPDESFNDGSWKWFGEWIEVPDTEIVYK